MRVYEVVLERAAERDLKRLSAADLQPFRTRKNPKLETKAVHTYNQSGAYKVLVKVVDIFGNDTTKLLELTI